MIVFDVAALPLYVYTQQVIEGKFTSKGKPKMRKVRKKDANGNFVMDSRIAVKERARFSGKQGRAYTPENASSFEKHVAAEFLKHSKSSHGIMDNGKIVQVAKTFLGCQKYGATEPCTEFRTNHDFSACKGCKHKRKNLAVHIQVHLQDGRSLDLDNAMKIVLDSLNKICYYDDNQFRFKQIELIPYAKEEKFTIVLDAIESHFDKHKGFLGCYDFSKFPIPDAEEYLRKLLKEHTVPFDHTVVPEFWECAKRIDTRKYVHKLDKEYTDGSP